ncbi:glucose dehydrogenase [FAD, quinone]-like [Dermacentor andersoni]|uniref:glucose dehydrogenase [FAD, quinone]-like n=1 Tax=Dermacentor andersoni TaxID=34620 RepID=UPI003B3BA9A8
MLEELVEAQQVSQLERLSKTRRGRHVLEKLGITYHTQHGIKVEIPRTIREQLYVPPLPRNMHPQHHTRRLGGGSAGSVIANRLSANLNITVLLLEAGGLETSSRQIPVVTAYNLGGHDDWAYWTVPQKKACLSFREQRCPLPLGKVLGGSSVLNYMVYVRGKKFDYNRWDQKYGAKGWAYEDVLPHFNDIEDYRVGPLGGNWFPQSGIEISTSPFVAEWCSLPCVHGIYVKPCVNFEGNRAVGMTFTRYGKTQSVSARREVILSAGTVGSAQILMLSGVGPKKDLEQLKIPLVSHLPVGRSIQDHVLFLTAIPVITDWQAGIPLFSLDDIAQYHSNRTAKPESPDIQLLLISTQRANQLARAELLNLGLLPEAYDSYLGPRDNDLGFRLAVINNRPKSRGRITLRSSDPNVYPNIDFRMMEHPDDAKVAAEGAKAFIDQILNTDAMRSIGAKLWDITFPPCAEAGARWSLEYIECLFRHMANSAWHTCCTAPMGWHQAAVVDERLRVRGNITDLRVADASVMPDIVSGNTHAPTMMIGSKAAAMIMGDNGLQ